MHMATYLIGYNSAHPDQFHEELTEAIESFPNYWHCLECTWIIKSDWSIPQIADALDPHLDTNDKLLILQLEGSYVGNGFKDQCSEWLEHHLEQASTQ